MGDRDRFSLCFREKNRQSIQFHVFPSAFSSSSLLSLEDRLSRITDTVLR